MLGDGITSFSGKKYGKEEEKHKNEEEKKKENKKKVNEIRNTDSNRFQ